jgi:branched-chain amino acid transport system ATP-binding protein
MTLPIEDSIVSPTLIVENLTKNFAGLQALDSVSMRIHPKEIVGLIGPNGSGKTTLINVITGFLKSNGGRILIDQMDITDWSPTRISHLGLARTFQTVKVFHDLTVLENVEVAAVSKGISRRNAQRAAIDILHKLEIPWSANTYPSQLPSYDLRRTEIARALVSNPTFLLLDEPAAGLNEAECSDLLATLGAILRELGCGTLVVDHDMSLIMRLCDRLYVLNHGALICEGTPETVSEDPMVIEAYLGAPRQESSGVSP